MDVRREVAERYERFVRHEVGARSALYTEWAEGVASDPVVQDVLARIPAHRRQPPLVFAVARMLGAEEGDYRTLADWIVAHADELVAEVSRRLLQTNEPQRCAPLLAALSLVEGPIALLEIGVSGGLCLYPDRYSFRYRPDAALAGEDIIAIDPPSGPSPVLLECELRGPGRPTLARPEIVWRAGVDLAPLDARDRADRAFLTSLVWPGEEGRMERIGSALDVVAADPPLLVAADATSEGAVERLAARAPAGATLVVTTPGVMPHIPRAGREALVGSLQGLDAQWISIDPAAMRREGPGAWTTDPPAHVSDADAGFALSLGTVPLAWCDPLGGWMEWHTGMRARRD